MGSRTRALGSRRSRTSGGRFAIVVHGSRKRQLVATARVARSIAIPWRTARACVYDVAWQSAVDRTFGQRRTLAPAQLLAKAAFLRHMGKGVWGGRVRPTAKRNSPTIFVVEDNAARSNRRSIAGVTDPGRTSVLLQLHKIGAAGPVVVAQRRYRTGKRRKTRRVELALQLLNDSLRARQSRCVIVAGTAYGSNEAFVAGLIARSLDFATEIRPSTRLITLDDRSRSGRKKPVTARALLRDAAWKKFKIRVPGADAIIDYYAADLGNVRLGRGTMARLVAAQTGGISGLHRGTVFFLTSQRDPNLKRVLQMVGWARWIRPAVRREERKDTAAAKSGAPDRVVPGGTSISVRANIHLGRRQDESTRWEDLKAAQTPTATRGVFASLKRINVVELFAGAGGMGLGFLLAANNRARYRLVYSGEAHPIYSQTLKRNHDEWRRLRGRRDDTPKEVRPVDLRTLAAFNEIKARVKECGGAHLLIGGPPCQGFSSANRNSWHGANPNNDLVRVFMRYVQTLQPLIFLMENVQGILWTPRTGQRSNASVVHHLERRFAAMGYTVFPKLLDAVWYGVPQHRSRFFLLGIRSDLGYSREDFGEWGPYPLPTHGPGTERPYVTVRDAIRDLPAIGNGHEKDLLRYNSGSTRVSSARNDFLRLMRSGARGAFLSDHVTSRHADYVIDRYRAIPPGENWEAISDKLTNYTAVQRTHSNIYRRLTWDEPSITIGHYRKSMLVHPRQHRGLSLREASRLQSFPDWFRFAGSANGNGGGLVHKQQQLANAVCPLVTKAIAEFVLTL
jgi:DNA-cytosine methyltransferase